MAGHSSSPYPASSKALSLWGLRSHPEESSQERLGPTYSHPQGSWTANRSDKPNCQPGLRKDGDICMYIYIFFFPLFEFQPKKYSRKRCRGWAGSPSKDICYQGQWAGLQPGYPSPLLPAHSRKGETVEVGEQLGTGQGSGGSGVRSWAEAEKRWELPCAVIFAQ